jgi:hypothetical protein
METPAEQSAYLADRKKMMFGLALVILPFALLFAVLAFYIGAGFVLSSPRPIGRDPLMVTHLGISANSATISGSGAAHTFNIDAGLLIIIAFLGLFVLVPLGLALVGRSRGEIASGIKGVGRSAWIYLAVLIPYVGPFWLISLGDRGDKRQWKSWAISLFVLQLLFCLGLCLYMVALAEAVAQVFRSGRD